MAEMLVSSKKIRDNTPDIRPAGKAIIRGHSTKECMVTSPSILERGTPDLVKRVRGMLRPEPGQQWELPERTGDPPVDKDIVHGVKTSSSLKATHLVNPPAKTKFQHACLDQREAVYKSRDKVLGGVHDQSSNLPKGMDAASECFGKKTERGDSLQGVVSPQKTMEQVEKEYAEGRELYKKSHNDWGVGEIVDRNYNWSKFTKDTKYGMETPHDNRGTQVSCALDWTKNTDDRKVIVKRLDDFREKTQHQLATTLDPIADTLDVPPTHTFGTVVPIDEYNAGDLVQCEGPNDFSACVSLDTGLLASVRNHLKKKKFNKFDAFFEAMHEKDKAGSGLLPPDSVYDVAFQFQIPMTINMLEMLVRWTTIDPRGAGPGGVAYEDLAVLMNWNYPVDDERLAKIAEYGVADRKQPSLGESNSSLSKLHLTETYKTSSQAYKATTGDLSTHNYRIFGVPTIRSDLPAPRLKRISDHKNYGDEADSSGLINPSIYSNYGVHPEDFFRPHPPEKIRSIFKAIGVVMTNQEFKDLWEMAAKNDPKGCGEVSVETFRMAAEEAKAQGMLGAPKNPAEQGI